MTKGTNVLVSALCIKYCVARYAWLTVLQRDNNELHITTVKTTYYDKTNTFTIHLAVIRLFM